MTEFAYSLNIRSALSSALAPDGSRAFLHTHLGQDTQ